MLHRTVLEQVAETVLSLTGSSLLKIMFSVDHTLEHRQLARLADDLVCALIAVTILFDHFVRADQEGSRADAQSV